VLLVRKLRDILSGTRKGPPTFQGVLAAPALGTMVLFCGCQIARDHRADVADPRPRAKTTESPVRQPPAEVPIARDEAVPSVASPNLALAGPITSSASWYGPLASSENQELFATEKKLGPTSTEVRLPSGSFSCPLWANDRNEWSASATASPPSFCTGSRQAPPASPWTVGAGTAYQHRLKNGWIGGWSATAQSGSNNTGTNWGPVSAWVNAFVQVPQNPHADWQLSLSYSSSNAWCSALPRIAYMWHPSESLQAGVGLTLPVCDRPEAGLSLNLSFKLLGPDGP
jgi:hypothetical protein